MSIFATWLHLGNDHEDDCDIWDKQDGLWEISGRPCTCGIPRCPIVYEGSHVLPSDDDRRGGAVLVCAIPDHITRDGCDDAPEGALKDWLRLSVHSEDSTTISELRPGKPPYEPAGDAAVILTRAHVEELRNTLTAWLDRQETA